MKLLFVLLFCFSSFSAQAIAEFRVSKNFAFDTRPLKHPDTLRNIARIKVGTVCGDFSHETFRGIFQYHFVTNEEGVTGVAVCEEVESENPHSAIVPGRVEFENYTLAKDTNPDNRGGLYRFDQGVDIQNATGEPDGANVGWVEKGEYLEYELVVDQTNLYFISMRYASREVTRSGRVELTSFGLFVDDVKISSHVGTVPLTGNWREWAEISLTPVFLPQGQYTLRFQFDIGHINLDWFEIKPIEFITIDVMAIS